ncbi:MAG: NUDIX domain-containing protein [Spirochaetales bacterium]|nr:NUDIX domain-containing protein [Spirochaetales bacterium]MBR6060974.1 NUDIX domain-containing protein [Spirochaetales bacterium]
MMELLDIYDENRNRTGKTFVRGTSLSAGQYRLVIHIVIFNSEGKMLIQQRTPTKDTDPNLWDVTVGGCAAVGDDSRSAAHRELMEELGLDIDFSHERPYITINFESGFDDFYIFERDDIDLTELTLQASEVQNVQWATMQQVLAMLDRGEFIRYHEGFIRYLFDQRHHRGCHKKLI